MKVLKELLDLRGKYMRRAGISDTTAVLTDAQRRELLATMKDEYHSRPEQVVMQIRDSWKAIPENHKKGQKGKNSSPSG